MNQPPIFTEAPEDLEVVQGDRCDLFCKVKGKPMPDLLWFRDDEEIHSNESTVKTSVQSDIDYDTEGTLRMKKVMSGNRGRYRIEAKNSVGGAFHEFNMEGKTSVFFSCNNFSFGQNIFNIKWQFKKILNGNRVT